MVRTTILQIISIILTSKVKLMKTKKIRQSSVKLAHLRR